MVKNRLLVALNLTPSADGREHEDEEEGEDGYGIWPAQKKETPLPVKLGDDLIFHSILVRLPFPRLLKLRSVSRSWLSHLSSRDFWLLWFRFNPKSNPNPNCNTFLDLYSDAGPNGSLYYKRYPLNDLLFELLVSQLYSNPNPNPNPSPWSSRPIPCLLLCSASSCFGHASRWMKEKSIRYVRETNEMKTHRSSLLWLQLDESFLQMQDPHTILACEGGLILLARYSDADRQLIVCNPLLRAHKVLPSPIFSFVKFISVAGLIVDVECNEYTVIISDVNCQVYCSKHAKWKLISQTFFENATSMSPPMLDGSFFWLSQEQKPSGFLTLSAYHATQEVVTSVRMRYPDGITPPKLGRIWKDSRGLFSLDLRSRFLTVWQLDFWLWEQEKYIPNSLSISKNTFLDYVKVGNLLCFKGYGNEMYICNLDLQRGCTSPPCPFAAMFTDHIVFQPSYMLV